MKLPHLVKDPWLEKGQAVPIARWEAHDVPSGNLSPELGYLHGQDDLYGNRLYYPSL